MILVLLLPELLISQDSLNNNALSRYGLYVNYGLNSHNAEFSSLPKIPNCCPEFTNGSGNSIYFGGIYEMNFDDFGLELRGGLELMKGSFKSSEDVILGIIGNPTPGTFEHLINFDINNVSFDVAFQYPVTRNFLVSLGLGANYAFDSHYNQKEKVSSQFGKVTFADSNGVSTGKSTRNEFTGELPDLNKLQINSFLKIGYEIPIEKTNTWIIRPEIGVKHNFNNMLEDVEWSTIAARFGVSILFDPNPNNFEPNDYSDIPLMKLDEKLSENENNDKMANEKLKQLEDLINKEKEEKIKLERQIAVQDSILKQNQLAQQIEIDKIANERQRFEILIDEENKITGKICKCYYIQYISTNQKSEAEFINSELIKNGFKDTKITVFIEPYLKDKYYRIQSKCFANHLEAFDERIKAMQMITTIQLNPQILCKR
jgi:hypothetical protein